MTTAELAPETPTRLGVSGAGSDEGGPRTGLFLAGLVTLVGGIPLAIALGVLRQPRWYPVVDLAVTELRVRDVGEGHPPLVGLAGRIHTLGQRGSHPGPLSFWSLYPLYRLFGASAWALQVATAMLNLAAMGLAVWIGHRRAGRVGALGIAAALALVGRAYGAEKLTEPWNPFLPLLWWIVFVLAVWSLLDDDLPLLPVAVFAGSFCLQTHYGYLGLTTVLGLLALGGLGGHTWRRRDEPHRTRRLLSWGGASLVLAGLLWIGPLIDHLAHEPSNLGLLRQAIAHPDEELVIHQDDGLRRTIEIGLAHLDPGRLLEGTATPITPAPDGPVLPGAVLLLTWVGATVAAVRTGPAALRRLHLVVGAALVLGFVSIARIAGEARDYLVLWGWGTTTLVLVAVIWTAAVAWPSRLSWRRAWPPRPAVAGLVGVLVVLTLAFSYDAAHARMPTPHLQSEIVGGVAPDTITALRRGSAPGGGEDGRYLVHWHEDALAVGMSGFGLFLELDRAGFEVGLPEQPQGVQPDWLVTEAGGSHRVLRSDRATAAIHLVIGERFIDSWDETAAATRVASYDPRTPAETREFGRLHDEALAIFRTEGRSDLVEQLDSALLVAALNDPPRASQPRLARMMELGLPAAVFVAPVGVWPPA